MLAGDIESNPGPKFQTSGKSLHHHNIIKQYTVINLDKNLTIQD